MAKWSSKHKEFIYKRADGRCEYCKCLYKYSPAPFVIEHIMPLSAGGHSELDNLAFSCSGCNGHKYTKTKALDPITGKESVLFHPRHDTWPEHFEWDSELIRIIGITPKGRATIRSLHLNRAELINIRKITLIVGDHPPE